MPYNMDKYLIYNTEEELKAKALEEAIANNLGYPYAGAMMYTSEGKYALGVNGFTTLTKEEEALVVNNIP